MEADGHEKLNGQPVTWQFDYEWIYSWTSQYVHATSVSMESHLTLPRAFFVVHIAPYRNNRIGLNAVFNTALYLDKTLRMAFPAIGHSIPTKMVEQLNPFLLKSSDQMSRLGFERFANRDRRRLDSSGVYTLPQPDGWKFR